jgi:hypothetical protein
MLGIGLRHSENTRFQACRVHDTRAPCVEQFVHYRRTREENGQGRRPFKFLIQTGPGAASPPHLLRVAAACVKTDFLYFNQVLVFTPTARTTLL